MSYVEVSITLLILGLGWLWHGSMVAREIAIQAVRAACVKEEYQLLDETIAITQLKTDRDREGRLRWLRVYQFEYSDTGDNRCPGCVHVLGSDVTLLGLGGTLAVYPSATDKFYHS